jgi:REP element-mobilizing transposase RayT
MEKIIPYNLYHIIWCPKYRYRILKGAVAEYIESNLRMFYVNGEI